MRGSKQQQPCISCPTCKTLGSQAQAQVTACCYAPLRPPRRSTQGFEKLPDFEDVMIGFLRAVVDGEKAGGGFGQPSFRSDSQLRR